METGACRMPRRGLWLLVSLHKIQHLLLRMWGLMRDSWGRAAEGEEEEGTGEENQRGRENFSYHHLEDPNLRETGPE